MNNWEDLERRFRTYKPRSVSNRITRRIFTERSTSRDRPEEARGLSWIRGAATVSLSAIAILLLTVPGFAFKLGNDARPGSVTAALVVASATNRHIPSFVADSGAWHRNSPETRVFFASTNPIAIPISMGSFRLLMHSD